MKTLLNENLFKQKLCLMKIWINKHFLLNTNSDECKVEEEEI